MEFEKFEKDGKVAVLVSPGRGAGWSTWVRKSPTDKAIAMDKQIVQYVLDKDLVGLEQFMKKEYPDVYLGGMKDLVVEWVTKGEALEITEHDGYESLTVIGEQEYWIA